MPDLLLGGVPTGGTATRASERSPVNESSAARECECVGTWPPTPTPAPGSSIADWRGMSIELPEVALCSMDVDAANAMACAGGGMPICSGGDAAVRGGAMLAAIRAAMLRAGQRADGDEAALPCGAKSYLHARMHTCMHARWPQLGG